MKFKKFFVVTMLGTVADEGGQFLDNQMKAGQPVLKTVGDISDTIGSSDFVQGVAGGAGTVATVVPRLVSTKIGLTQDTVQVKQIEIFKLFICKTFFFR